MPGKGELRGEGGRDQGVQLPDITALLAEADSAVADAERAAGEAERAEREAEAKTVRKTKKNKEEEVLRIEAIETVFNETTVDGSNDVEPFWEMAFYEAQEELGIAPSKEIEGTIASLRMATDYLKRLVSAPSSPAIERSRTTLRAAHEQYFTVVKTETLKALDAVKKKYKGEVSEAETELRQLVDGPLARRIERPEDSVEAREEALRRNLTEVFLRPMVDGYLAPAEVVVKETARACQVFRTNRSDLEQSLSQHPSGSSTRDVVIENFCHEHKLNKAYFQREYGRIPDFSHVLSKFERDEQEARVNLRHIQVAIETNRALLEETLIEEEAERTEEDLRAAFQDVHPLLQLHAGVRSSDWRGRINDAHPLAKKLVGRFFAFGKSPDVLATQETKGIDALANIRHGDPFSVEVAEAILNAYIKEQLDMSDALDILDITQSRMYSFSPESLARAYEQAARVNRVDKTSKDQWSRFTERYPTKDVFASAILQKDASVFAIRRASDAIEAPVSGEEIRGTMPPKSLVDQGWKQAKNGAFVPPGESVRTIERVYTTLLERFSNQTVEAQSVFDERGEDGEFVVHTLGQAMDLLRRARRDALTLRREREETNTEMGAKETALNQRVATLEHELKEAARAHKEEMEERDKKIVHLEAADTLASKSLREEKERTADMIAELRRLSGIQALGIFQGGAGKSFIDLQAKLLELVQNLEGGEQK